MTRKTTSCCEVINKLLESINETFIEMDNVSGKELFEYIEKYVKKEVSQYKENKENKNES